MEARRRRDRRSRRAGGGAQRRRNPRSPVGSNFNDGVWAAYETFFHLRSDCGLITKIFKGFFAKLPTTDGQKHSMLY